MAGKTKQLRGSLRKLLHKLTVDDNVAKDLLESSIQDTVRAIQTGKDDTWVAGQVAKKIDQVFDYRDRF